MATTSTPVYDPATHCTGAPAPGAEALAARVIQLFPGATIGGIYECRQGKGRGAGSLSEHAEGRAIDFSISGTKVGDAVAAFAVKFAALLGIQSVIWNDQAWSTLHPAWHPYLDPATGKPYASPTLGHRDHVHVGLNRNAAANLTAADLANVRSSGPAGAAQFVSGLGGDLVSSAVEPFIDSLRKLLITGLIVGAAVGLVVAGTVRGVSGRPATHVAADKAGHLAKEGAKKAATTAAKAAVA